MCLSPVSSHHCILGRMVWYLWTGYGMRKCGERRIRPWCRSLASPPPHHGVQSSVGMAPCSWSWASTQVWPLWDILLATPVFMHIYNPIASFWGQPSGIRLPLHTQPSASQHTEGAQEVGAAVAISTPPPGHVELVSQIRTSQETKKMRGHLMDTDSNLSQFPDTLH